MSFSTTYFRVDLARLPKHIIALGASAEGQPSPISMKLRYCTSASSSVIKAVYVPRPTSSSAARMPHTPSPSSVVVFVCLRLCSGWIFSQYSPGAKSNDIVFPFSTSSIGVCCYPYSTWHSTPPTRSRYSPSSISCEIVTCLC